MNTNFLPITKYTRNDWATLEEKILLLEKQRKGTVPFLLADSTSKVIQDLDKILKYAKNVYNKEHNTNEKIRAIAYQNGKHTRIIYMCSNNLSNFLRATTLPLIDEKIVPKNHQKTTGIYQILPDLTLTDVVPYKVEPALPEQQEDYYKFNNPELLQLNNIKLPTHINDLMSVSELSTQQIQSIIDYLQSFSNLVELNMQEITMYQKAYKKVIKPKPNVRDKGTSIYQSIKSTENIKNNHPKFTSSKY